MAQPQRLVGIDFGTSTSVVRVKRYQDGEPIGDSFSSGGVTFGNGETDTKAVTLVRENPDGSLTCGTEAAEQVPGCTVHREFKMELESPDPEKRRRAQQLTAAYFRYLYERYDHQRSDLGESGDEERTLVSLPVKWQEETRAFMAKAAEQAGFRQISIMDEPTAALYATLCRKMNEINQKGLLRVGEPGYLLLVDMGAGTTDLAVCRYTVSGGAGALIRADQIKNEIVAVWPESGDAATFGGREVDQILEHYVETYLTGCGIDSTMAAQLVRGSGNSAAKLWKENTVSKNLNEGKPVETCGFISGIAMALGVTRPFPAFGRAEFEAMLGDKLEQFKGLAAGCLNRASDLEPELLAKGLDLVILTGGHSSWYFTEELLSGAMPGLALPQLERVQRERSRVIRLTNPQETVALGLVYSQLPFRVAGQPKREAPPEPEHSRETERSRETGSHSKARTSGSGGSNKVQSKAQKPKRNAREARALTEEELAALVPDFLAGYDAVFLNELRCEGNMVNFHAYLSIPASATIYLAHDDTILHSGKNGFALCSDGIHCKDFSGGAAVTKWSEFASGTLRGTSNNVYLSGPAIHERVVSYYTGDDRIRSGVLPFLTALQARLRDGTPQKAAAHQTGAPAREDSLTGLARNFILGFSPAFLQSVQRVGSESALRSTLNIPWGCVLYLAHDDTWLKTGSNGFAIGQDGIYCKDFGQAPVTTEWIDFLNGTLVPLDSSQPTNVRLIVNGLSRPISYFSGDRGIQGQIHEFFTLLQAHLRSGGTN